MQAAKRTEEHIRLERKAKELEAELRGIGHEVYVDPVLETEREGEWFLVAFEATEDEARKLTEEFLRLQIASEKEPEVCEVCGSADIEHRVTVAPNQGNKIVSAESEDADSVRQKGG